MWAEGKPAFLATGEQDCGHPGCCRSRQQAQATCTASTLHSQTTGQGYRSLLQESRTVDTRDAVGPEGKPAFLATGEQDCGHPGCCRSRQQAQATCTASTLHSQTTGQGYRSLLQESRTVDTRDAVGPEGKPAFLATGEQDCGHPGCCRSRQQAQATCTASTLHSQTTGQGYRSLLQESRTVDTRDAVGPDSKHRLPVPPVL